MSAPTDLRARNDIDADPARLSPALRITRAPSTVLVSYGDPEPNKKTNPDTYLAEQGRLLIRALDSFGANVHPVALQGVDHIGSATAFSDRRSPLFEQARKVIFNSGP
jgi:arylformamidase